MKTKQVQLAKTKVAKLAASMSNHTTTQKIDFAIENKLNIIFSSFYSQGWTRVNDLDVKKEIKFNDIDKNFGTGSYYMNYLAVGKKELTENDKLKLIKHAENGFINKHNLNIFKIYLNKDSGFC
ncbi:MAG: hypothetical protein OEV44_00140 [Spirochaetota bacterium]|nr:hypothetical protein [Spirochaetota bacterium]